MQWYSILKLVRINNGLTLRQVAQETHLSNSYISQLENGQVKEPSFFKMLRLLSLYNIDEFRKLWDTAPVFAIIRCVKITDNRNIYGCRATCDHPKDET